MESFKEVAKAQNWAVEPQGGKKRKCNSVQGCTGVAAVKEKLSCNLLYIKAKIKLNYQINCFLNK
jgi:hypothetical protein